MENFKLLKIEDSLKNSLHKMNFTKPTPIQGMAIPAALEGKDILGTAQTGTGKTLAFSIPLINKLILDKNAFALVMCPTRELDNDSLLLPILLRYLYVFKTITRNEFFIKAYLSRNY